MLAELKGNDLILCLVTSHAREDDYSVRLADSDFITGSLKLDSRIRPNRLFTADAGIVVYRAGQVSVTKLNETVERLISILRQG